jgi:D-alanyl-lipoteichoic acid acyltransferase DltB (MBOAT superfamily)
MELHKRKRISASEKDSVGRKAILYMGLTVNVGLLFYYKYLDFFIVNLNYLTGSDFILLDLILPLAISFFTFQQVAYLVDCYKEETLEYDFLNYCLFVTFFPQLIAGPIVHHKDMMPQFLRKRNAVVHWNNIALGLFIFAVGLFKKVYIADSFAVWANSGYEGNSTLSFFDAWGISLSYTFQLYYDFSGYSDMAIGAALLFNIRLPVNFNSPYQAANIQDFWRRWHMTLSTWLRDYIYFPLGGNKNGEARAFIAIFITFVIGGVWHGAGWMFLVWGCMHGLALCLYKVWSKLGFRLNSLLSWLITFLFVNFSWIFFRAPTWEGAKRILNGMMSIETAFVSKDFSKTFNYVFDWPWFHLSPVLNAPQLLLPIKALEMLTIFSIVAFVFPNTLKISGYLKEGGCGAIKYSNKLIGVVSLILYLSFYQIFSEKVSSFLYFNF